MNIKDPNDQTTVDFVVDPAADNDEDAAVLFNEPAGTPDFDTGDELEDEEDLDVEDDLDEKDDDEDDED